MADTLQAIITRRAELVAERTGAEAAHKNKINAIAAELAVLAKTEACIMAGLDAAKIERGRAVIYVHGKVTEVRHPSDRFGTRADGVRAAAVENARRDIAAGGDALLLRYRGVKNYEAFGDQGADCEYGMRPRHGDIVFEVGMVGSARARVRGGEPLTPEEIDAALYLLTALPQIEAAEALAYAS